MKASSYPEGEWGQTKKHTTNKTQVNSKSNLPIEVAACTSAPFPFGLEPLSSINFRINLIKFIN